MADKRVARNRVETMVTRIDWGAYMEDARIAAAPDEPESCHRLLEAALLRRASLKECLSDEQFRLFFEQEELISEYHAVKSQQALYEGLFLGAQITRGQVPNYLEAIRQARDAVAPEADRALQHWIDKWEDSVAPADFEALRPEDFGGDAE